MWFKQAFIFEFSKSLKNPEELNALLSPLQFTPCLPSLASSIGWISPMENNHAPLVYSANHFMVICLQFEEKILPSVVIREALKAKITELEQSQSHKVSSKEKKNLKDEITQTLLPRAFTKKSCIHGLIDLKNNKLILNTHHKLRAERFVSFLKRAIAPISIDLPETKKPSSVMTDWLKNHAAHDFLILQNGVLQDTQQFRRLIRFQYQDLYAKSVQVFLKENCEVTQLGLSWKDQVQFVLNADFSLKNIKFQDEVLKLAQNDKIETKEQQFDTDFVIMSEILSHLINALLIEFSIKTVMLEAVA